MVGGVTWNIYSHWRSKDLKRQARVGLHGVWLLIRGRRMHG